MKHSKQRADFPDQQSWLDYISKLPKRTPLQESTTRRNFNHLLLKGAVCNLSKVCDNIKKDGGTIKFDPKLNLILTTLSAGIESAWENQKKIYPPLPRKGNKSKIPA